MALTTDDVRHFLLDYAELNKLHDFKVIFKDTDINRALNWSVEEYNSEPPLHIRITTLADIPSNKLLLMGAVIYLLRSLVNNYQRNQLDYNDGGISISDKNQHAYIERFLSQYVPEYKDQLSKVKQYININSAFGESYSQWGSLGAGFDFRSTSGGSET